MTSYLHLKFTLSLLDSEKPETQVFFHREDYANLIS